MIQDSNSRLVPTPVFFAFHKTALSHSYKPLGWQTPIMTTLGKLRQENRKLEANLKTLSQKARGLGSLAQQLQLALQAKGPECTFSEHT